MFVLVIGVRGFGDINIHMLKYKWKKKGKFKQPSYTLKKLLDSFYSIITFLMWIHILNIKLGKITGHRRVYKVQFLLHKVQKLVKLFYVVKSQNSF